MLADYRTAPVDDRLRATLALLEKLTLRPEEVEPSDVEAARAAGATEAQIREAIYVCAVFNIIDRIADSLAFDVPPPESFAARADRMLAARYRMPR